MIALVIAGTWFLIAMLLGVFAGIDRLVLPGFLGLIACWGLAVWCDTATYNRRVREFRLDEEPERARIIPIHINARAARTRPRA